MSGRPDALQGIVGYRTVEDGRAKRRFQKSVYLYRLTAAWTEKSDASASERGVIFHRTKKQREPGTRDGAALVSMASQLKLWEKYLQTLELLPCWRETMEDYYDKVLNVGRRLIPLIALALNLDSTFFNKSGMMDEPLAFVRLLHYPGKSFTLERGIIGRSSNLERGTIGASAHSDYGMLTLLMTDGVQGLQICRHKDNWPQHWQDVPPLKGAFVINIGDMLERWSNCLFRSTLHRVLINGQERYSVAFFLDPNVDCLVECLPSCCTETNLARFPPIRSGDYLQERIKMTYSSTH